MTPAVVMREVTVSFDRVVVVDDASATFEHGEWIAVVGPNGAGKTTMLRAVAGLVGYRGHIDVDGCEPRGARPRELARHVAYVPQDPHLPAAMTVRDYVLLGRTGHLSYFGAESRGDQAVVDDVLTTLDIESFAGRPLSTLSGGEQQRAVVARALAQQAPIVVVDEPTTALDLGRQHSVLELIDDLRRRRGLTVISAIHDLTLAGQFADRLLLLAGGRIVATGEPSAVLTEAAIRDHWGVHVRITHDPSGAPVVVPVRQRVIGAACA